MRNSKNAVILGYDAVSPLGTDLKDQWNRAAKGESGIGDLTRFPLKKNFPVRIAGQVEEHLTQAQGVAHQKTRYIRVRGKQHLQVLLLLG